MKILCVIPSRSGSKEIPNKNIKIFNGKPLIAHTISYAKKCKLITHTIVSTDSEEYAKIATQHGGNVPFLRPKKYSSDLSQDIDFMFHAVVECEKLNNIIYDFIILLRVTSPLRPKKLIEKALDLMILNPEATSIKAVMPSKEHPYKHWVPDGKYIRGYENSIHEPYNLPRQQLPKAYYSAGDLEIVKRDVVLNGSVSGDKVIPLLLSREEVIDIDSIEDWNKAEIKKNNV